MKIICPICGEEVVSVKILDIPKQYQDAWQQVWVHPPIEDVNFNNDESIFQWVWDRNIWMVHHNQFEPIDIDDIDDIDTVDSVLAFEYDDNEGQLNIEVEAI